MELRTFIHETLTQIVSGVREAQAAAQAHGANINPTDFDFLRDGQSTSTLGPMPQDVHFDVALTSTEAGGVQGGIGVFLGTFKIGTEGKSDVQTSAMTRVRFTVPIALPSGHSMREERPVSHAAKRDPFADMR